MPKKCHILLLLAILCQSFVFGQFVREEHIKGAFIYKIISNTKWIDVPSKDSLNVYILESKENYSYILHYFFNKKSSSYHTSFKTINSTPDLSKCDILIVTPTYNYVIDSVINISKNKSILLITDDYDNEENIMVNLRKKNDKLSFDFNQNNLDEARITISRDMILRGGTRGDIVDLYSRIEDSLSFQRKALTDLMLEYKEVQEKFDEADSMLSSTMKMLDTQKDSLLVQKRATDSVSKSLKKQKKEYNKRVQLIEDMQNELNINKKLSDEQLKNIANQNTLLIERQNTLKQFDAQISKMKKTITKKDDAIKQKQLAINLQKQVNTLSITGLVIIVILLAFITRAFIIKRRDNNELIQKNEIIHQHREELSLTVEQLKNTQSKLVNSEKMASLGQLTAGIAHEINNPINFISSSVHSLELDLKDLLEITKAYDNINPESDLNKELLAIEKLKQELDYDILIPELNEIIENITGGVKRTIEIVRGLRTFSRLDEENIKHVDVHQNINATLVLLHNEYKNRIEIIKDFDENLPEIECLPGPMNQVYMNIISNAIGAIESTGTITIQTSQNLNSNQVNINISDSGCGISKEIIDKIFDPFFTTKEVGKGTGLGLSITKNIIEKHSGELHVTSSPGSGTTFHITLPIQQNT